MKNEAQVEVTLLTIPVRSAKKYANILQYTQYTQSENIIFNHEILISQLTPASTGKVTHARA